MEFIHELNQDLPKLSWISICSKNKVFVHYGPCVEAQEIFCIAGAWDGEFSAGNFDKTDLVAGTGIRFRGNKVIFVTPGNTLDRIVYYMSDDSIYVSNSLTAILTMADLSLIEEYNYEETLESIVQGLYKYQKELPTEQGPIRLVYYNNLEYNGQELKEVPKLNTSPHFLTFDNYYN